MDFSRVFEEAGSFPSFARRRKAAANDRAASAGKTDEEISPVD
jgi:hypothetical protein